jgi:hypothetical protein
MKFTEIKQRLDPKCWTGKKIGNPKTKVKGGVRVNNCVPAESVEEAQDTAPKMGAKEKKLAQGALKGAKDMSKAFAGLYRDKDGVLRSKDTKQQGVSEDDAGDVEQRMLVKIEKEKQRLAKLKQTDPEAYKREIAKHKQTSRMPAVSTFEQQGVAEGPDSKKFYTDKKQWLRDVDDVNHSVYGDESEYLGDTGRSTVKINGREWARWSDAQQKGHIDMGSMSEQGVAEEYNPEYDDEAGMADNNLETLARTVEGIDNLIQSGDNLPEWCQEKIAVAKSMLVAVWDYMESEEDSEEVDPEVDEMFEALESLAEELAERTNVDVESIWETFEALDDNKLYETAAWRRKEGKSKSGGLNAKGVASYRRENPGSKLQTAVTTKPSKLKPGSKAAKRRKSFCARMSGVKGPMKKPNGKPTRKALALRKWNC